MVEVPLQFPPPEGVQEELSPSMLVQRDNSVMSVTAWEEQLDLLARIDLLTEYASALYELNESGNLTSSLSQDLLVCLVDTAFLYREVALDVMQRAYGSDKAEGAWSTGGSYLRMGLGLLQFAANWLSPSSLELSHKQEMCGMINDMMDEIKLLQQIGIVVLSLSKLRAKFYNDQKDAVLDFQEEDLKDLAANSVLYSKLVIGCLNTAATCKQESSINNALFAYLNSLCFLLLSLDHYQRDDCGIAVGMIEHAVKYISKIVTKSQLDDPLLSKRRKRDILKNALHKKAHPRAGTSSRGVTGPTTWLKKEKPLLPLLQETLEDFLLPLLFLLRYRYSQTNDKISMQPVEHDESTLRKLFPSGKAPNAQSEHWIYDRRARSLTPERVSSIGGYY
ncbi:YGR122W [Zygosaccharomyces parabailii]|nr:YGR122W [Zygosaccharomyces parabailii]CDH08987.1 uncharacterized protein ZBAI_00771 [Zygosaccharomyces bailii ISA1307]